VIANGRTPGILERICAGDKAGTVFYSALRTEEAKR
jgi:hypothetical protein